MLRHKLVVHLLYSPAHPIAVAEVTLAGSNVTTNTLSWHKHTLPAVPHISLFHTSFFLSLSLFYWGSLKSGFIILYGYAILIFILLFTSLVNVLCMCALKSKNRSNMFQWYLRKKQQRHIFWNKSQFITAELQFSLTRR